MTIHSNDEAHLPLTHWSNTTTRKEEQLAQWAITRQKGKTRFILLNGALGWGLTTAVLYSLLMRLVMGSNLKTMLPIALVLFPIGGLLWGWCVWSFNERKLQKSA